MLANSMSSWVSARGAKRATAPVIEDPALRAAAELLTKAGFTVIQPEEDPAVRPRLSQREQQVAELLLEGASNKVIARQLDISVHTAKFHVAAILEKLGAHNRADAVSIILREGLVVL